MCGSFSFVPWRMVKVILIVSILMGTYTLAQHPLDDWLGEYEGKMILGYSNGKVDSLDIEFTFKELVNDTIWSHKMIYKSEKWGEITKDYYIRSIRKTDTINFILDERNGIELQATLMNNSFYEFYNVMGSYYATTLRKEGEKLIFDLFSAPENSLKENEVEGDDGPIKVGSIKTKLHQTAILYRK